MQIKVSKLRTDLALLQPVVPKKPTLAVLSNVLIKDGHITATDLEARVSLRIDDANGGFWLMPCKSVLELLKYVPGDDILTIDPNSKKLKFSWSGGSASFDSVDAQEYPDIDLKKPDAEGMLDGDMLVPALVAALPYCSTETSRPVLSGVTLYLGPILQIAGADGFRMSFQSLNIAYPVKQTIIIPSGTVAILEELWKKEPAQVPLASDLVSQITARRQLKLSLYEQDNTMEIKFGRVTIISRLIAGNPPDHLKLLNNFEEPIKVQFMAPELYNAVLRVRGIARDASGIVRLQWTDTQMTVSAASADKGEASAVFPVQHDSIPGRIGINIAYLLDYLKDKPGMVTMGKTTEAGAPALFHYGNRPIVVIMPMQVQWGDEPPAAQLAATSEAAGTEENPEPETEEETPDTPGDDEGNDETTEPVAVTEEQPQEPEPTKKRRGRRKKS